MRKIPKPSPTASPLLFELDPEPLEETLTALGGIPLVVQAFRSLGLPQSIQEHVRVKQRERGYDEATFVESFVILNAAGGECVEDFERLRGDPGLGGDDRARVAFAARGAGVFVCVSPGGEDRGSPATTLAGADRLYPGRDGRRWRGWAE